MIKKMWGALGGLMLSFMPAWASKECFLVKEKGHLIKSLSYGQEHRHIRYSPCSTFNIPLALMGYDAGFLEDEKKPEGYFWGQWRRTPTDWMKESLVWYGRDLVKVMDVKTFQDYVHKFSYGNKDIRGGKGENHGPANCWLSSSLKISPWEQCNLLEKLLENKMPVSDHAHAMTKNILYKEDLPHGWKLYGKTGSGSLSQPEKKHGWFVGWMEKGHRKILFVHHDVEDSYRARGAGPRAEEKAKKRLVHMIEAMEERKRSRSQKISVNT